MIACISYRVDELLILNIGMYIIRLPMDIINVLADKTSSVAEVHTYKNRSHDNRAGEHQASALYCTVPVFTPKEHQEGLRILVLNYFSKSEISIRT